MLKGCGKDVQCDGQSGEPAKIRLREEMAADDDGRILRAEAERQMRS